MIHTSFITSGSFESYLDQAVRFSSGSSMLPCIFDTYFLNLTVKFHVTCYNSIPLSVMCLIVVWRAGNLGSSKVLIIHNWEFNGDNLGIIMVLIKWLLDKTSTAGTIGYKLSKVCYFCQKDKITHFWTPLPDMTDRKLVRYPYSTSTV